MTEPGWRTFLTLEERPTQPHKRVLALQQWLAGGTISALVTVVGGLGYFKPNFFRCVFWEKYLGNIPTPVSRTAVDFSFVYLREIDNLSSISCNTFFACFFIPGIVQCPVIIGRISTLLTCEKIMEIRLAKLSKNMYNGEDIREFAPFTADFPDFYFQD